MALFPNGPGFPPPAPPPVFRVYPVDLLDFCFAVSQAGAYADIQPGHAERPLRRRPRRRSRAHLQEDRPAGRRRRHRGDLPGRGEVVEGSPALCRNGTVRAASCGAGDGGDVAGRPARRLAGGLFRRGGDAASPRPRRLDRGRPGMRLRRVLQGQRLLQPGCRARHRRPERTLCLRAAGACVTGGRQPTRSVTGLLAARDVPLSTLKPAPIV
jgi:hypothetical protein